MNYQYSNQRREQTNFGFALAIASTIFEIVQDLLLLAYALLSGRIRYGELWLGAKVLASSSKCDAQVQVQADEGSDLKCKSIASTTTKVNDNPSKESSACGVSGLCRAIVQQDVDRVSEYVY